MAITIQTWFPHATVPESRETFHAGNPLSQAKSTGKRAVRNQLVAAYDSSVQGYVLAKYVQFTAATAQGATVSYGVTAKAKVTKTASVANSGKAAGVSMQAQSSSTWGWIQVRGPNVFKVLTNKHAVPGGTLCKDQATDGMLRTAIEDGSEAWVVANSLTSDSGSFMAPGKLVLNFPTW